MKKSRILSISLLVASVLLSGCKKKVTYNDIVVGRHKIVSNNVSDYQLVIPDESNEYVNTAINEFQYFIKEASGATFEVVNESKQNVDTTRPYVSFGKTNLSISNGVNIPEGKRYLNSGYYLLNKDNNVYILADENYDQEGILYGAYDLLNTLTGYKAYSDDEFYIEKSKDILLPAIDKTYIPSFDERELGYKEAIGNKRLSNRLRLINKDGDTRWALHGHTATSEYFQLLSHEKYGSEHPEWYAPPGNYGIQLCYTGHGSGYESMVEQMAYNMYHNYIMEKPDAKYFMIGEEDNTTFCDCEACQAKNNEYGLNGAVSGLMVLFINDVINRIEAMMQEANDTVNLNRDIRYVFFAYQNSLIPFDSSKVVPHEKLYVEFTPIELDFAKDMHAEGSNSRIYDYLVKWDEIMNGRILVYSYDVDYRNYLINFNNFGSFKPYLLDYHNHHVDYFYSQGAVVNNVTGFTNMRLFVESQLLWNINLDYEDLVREFIEHYYKDASSYLHNYYQIIRDRYIYNVNALDKTYGIYADISSTDLWDKATSDALYSCLLNALLSIEKYRSSDPELYNKLYYRIKREMLSVYYIIIVNHSGYYSSSTLESMINEFYELADYFGITKVVEGGSGFPF